MFAQGGRTSEIAGIDTNLDKARLELKIAQDGYNIAVRLRDKKAGTESRSAPRRKPWIGRKLRFRLCKNSGRLWSRLPTTPARKPA